MMRILVLLMFEQVCKSGEMVVVVVKVLSEKEDGFYTHRKRLT
jgi:hypothetical protein